MQGVCHVRLVVCMLLLRCERSFHAEDVKSDADRRHAHAPPHPTPPHARMHARSRATERSRRQLAVRQVSCLFAHVCVRVHASCVCVCVCGCVGVYVSARGRRRLCKYYRFGRRGASLSIFPSVLCTLILTRVCSAARSCSLLGREELEKMHARSKSPASTAPDESWQVLRVCLGDMRHACAACVAHVAQLACSSCREMLCLST